MYTSQQIEAEKIQSNTEFSIPYNPSISSIDLVSDFTYLTQSERLNLLDELLADSKQLIDRAYQSDVLLDYYLSKIDDL